MKNIFGKRIYLTGIAAATSKLDRYVREEKMLLGWINADTLNEKKNLPFYCSLPFLRVSILTATVDFRVP